MNNNSYEAVMGRTNQIMMDSLQLDYTQYEGDGIIFKYEEMMDDVDYTLKEIIEMQRELGVGDTPLLELKNLTKLARNYAPEGKGARIFIKDEAANASGSYKDRRAAISVHHAKKLGYKGVVAATSGNYGAAVAAHAAKLGLRCIILQEAFDSRGVGQPEIIEKARKCEALGAEVIQLTVGPELFYEFLKVLEETGYFNASLYTPYAIAGIETLGYEIALQAQEQLGKQPDVVIATNAGGGNLTGTARGLEKASEEMGFEMPEIIAASVDLTGLHMASDTDFNRKSFTTGHTGFGIPFTTNPDRSDVPRSAARALRYMDRYLLTTQGEVFFITEALSRLEGLEKGPAGNTSLAVAFSLAQEMDEDQIIVIQETEYTGAGKNVQAQTSFAEENGVEIVVGDPKDDKPGENIVFPESFEKFGYTVFDLERARTSRVRHGIRQNDNSTDFSKEELDFLAKEINGTVEDVKALIEELQE